MPSTHKISGLGSFEERLVAACMTFRDAIPPPSTVQAAEMCILDWLGCVLLGATREPANAITLAHQEELGSGVALSFTGPVSVAPGVAALINGTASHTAELDDIYSPALYHPGAPVIAAALAAAQMVKANGTIFLNSVIAGYEVSNRIGTAINPAHYEFWHTTGTIGTLGAAVAAAHAMGLDAEKTGWAMAHASSMAAGLQQAFRSDGMTKPLHAGRAAEGGLLAARLAQSGLVGAEGMLSGDVGLGSAMGSNVNWTEAIDDLFVDFTIEQMTFKRFSACGHTFAAVDATLDLLEQEAIDPATIESIDIRTYKKATEVAGIAIPKSAFEARFSIPFGVAAALLGYDLTQSGTYDEYYAENRIQALMKRIKVNADSDFTGVFPKLRGARVRITFFNGSKREITVPTRKGEPANPLSNNELEHKFRGLASEAGFSDTAASELISWVAALKEGVAVSYNDISEMLVSAQ